MSDSRPEELIKAANLMNRAKFDEALALIENFENKGASNQKNTLSALIMKGWIYNNKYQWEEAIVIGERVYKESQEIGDISLTIDALIMKALVWSVGKIDEAFEYVLEAEKILNQLTECASFNVKRLRAGMLGMKSWILMMKGDSIKALELAFQSLGYVKKEGNKNAISGAMERIGYIYFTMGEPKLALDYAMKSLKLSEELSWQQHIAASLLLVGYCYSSLGILDQALKFSERALLIKECPLRAKSDILNIIGNIYMTKGELNRAIKYLKEALTIAQDINMTDRIGAYSTSLGRIYHMSGDYKKSKEYLEQGLTFSEGINRGQTLLFLVVLNMERNKQDQAMINITLLKDLVDQTKNRVITQQYQIAKAILLKAGGRARDHVQAEQILKQIVEEPDTIQLHVLSLINLCDLLIKELSMYNNPIVLDDINPLIIRLLNLAEEQHSYIWLAEAKLLQAKLKLIQLDISEAKQLLVQAQRIAELHGLQSLAQIISGEHDILFEQINLWNSLRNRNAPMSERIKLADFDEVVDRLEGKRAVESPKSVDEVPVLLLIIAEGGIPAFSKTFAGELSFEDDIISSFLTAFNSFSEEMFSKGLDRARFGDYMLVMDSIGSFSVCYLFKGQSYLAKQKLIHFAHRVQNTVSIWQVFKNFYKTNQSIELSENPLLESLITEIFLKGSPEISTLF
ncbi:MAG: tetratricopeptide repeat protein [Promethearchaeota archaeon]|jgi:tetratricopeptide (TPR) repeat protein